jgi:arylsulfatase A
MLALSVIASNIATARAAAPEASKPNIVIFLCDDMGYGDLGCFGHPAINTPNLDQLAADGLRMTDCYAAAPVCSASRAGMMTGRTPNRVGVYDWIPRDSPMHLRKQEITFARLLKDQGYETCHVGKWHLNGKFNSPEQPQPGDHGFDHWFSTQNNAAPTHHDPKNFVRNGRFPGPLKGYSSTIIANEALGWLDGRDTSKPFLLVVWFHTPHEIVATPARFTDAYRDKAATEDQAIYFGNITQMDAEVGRVLQGLDDRKLREDTFVLFTSDNGPETLNRYKTANHSYGSPGPLRGMKLHVYEGGIRVPGILRWPGHIAPGSVTSEPISGVDLLPTLCAITGAPVPTDRAIDGTSFLPALTGEPLARKTPLYWQYDVALSAPKIAIRNGDWKLLADASLTKFELYNLRSDLKEEHDLSSQEPERVKAMGETMRRLHEEIKKEGPEWPKGG